MLIEYWADYICPWCYLATDRVDHLVTRHGAELVWHPFELHPEIPPEGGEAPPLRRPQETKRWLQDELRSAGLPIRRRTSWSNSRRALALSTWARDRAEWPELHRRLYAAYWAHGRDIGSVEVLADVAIGAGLEAEVVRRTIAEGCGLDEMAVARERAFELGIGHTPGWLLAGGVVFTGVHERAVFDRVMARAGGR